MSSNPSTKTLSGIATARGYAAGPAFVYRGEGKIPIPEYRIRDGAESEEILRLRRARSETKRDLENLIAALRERMRHEDVRIFEGHLMILEDPVLCAGIEKRITEDRLNAEAAVRKATDAGRAQFAQMNDPYFRERVLDLDDVERRLLKALTGFGADPLSDLKAPSVIVANDLTPSEAVRMPREYVLGFVTNGGSATSHVALLARAMGIPAVTGLGNITEIAQAGDTLLVDGTEGLVTLSPDRRTLRVFRDLMERQREISEGVPGTAPAGMLKGGGEVPLFANVHPGMPVARLKDFGARGVGLYRSEYLWLNADKSPTEEEQFAAYREAAKISHALGASSEVTIRVLDIGGDKIVRGVSAKEPNPFLGNRSIRYLLSHPEMFRMQLRAILRASAFGRVSILYPLIACVEELKAATETLASVKRELDGEGIPFDHDIREGAMIEVPSAALNAVALAQYVRFFSIGTNDLVQYTLAADRGNETVSRLYQPTHPAVLKLVRMTVDAARVKGIPVSVCGESASDPVVGVLWAAFGVDSLSMSMTYIPVMAKIFSRLTQEDLAEYAAYAERLDAGMTAEAIYGQCKAWLKTKIPDIENIIL